MTRQVLGLLKNGRPGHRFNKDKMIEFLKRTRIPVLACSVLTFACSGCGTKHPETIQASPEQQQKWVDEENATSQKKLEEARARGAVR
jgi:hypothetical protein